MKILTSSLSIALLVFILSNTTFGSSNIFKSTTDQDTLKSYIPTAGKRAIAINVNPIFNYLGNMFNGSTGNSLDISAANVLYRKFKENNVVKRYRISFGISTSEFSLLSSTINFPYRLDAGTRRNFSTSLSFAYGKEKRYNYKKISLYTGWELISGISHYSSSYNYDYNEGDIISNEMFVQSVNRIKSGPSYTDLSVGVAGIFGAEYYFSKMFFAGMELSLPLVFTISKENSYQYQTARLNWPENVVSVTDDIYVESRYLMSGNVSSTNLIQFRAGIVF